jgi:hypothetical protein
MMFAVTVIVSTKMALTIMVLITDDGVRDEVDDIIEGECELRWHWQKLEYALSKMIIWMKLSMIIVLITDDRFRDDVDDDVFDDVIEGECELRWHWQKLEYAVAKMICPKSAS